MRRQTTANANPVYKNGARSVPEEEKLADAAAAEASLDAEIEQLDRELSIN